ncbi:MAG: hypothetical protein QG656_2724, partial [Candidatus Hydrogenedentes bacterium]|nr:hypothetical protein [Candidatus Hydrogenedentota bacterium]
MPKVWSVLFFLACCACSASHAIEDSDCFFCHGDADFSKTMPDGSVKPLFVDESAYGNGLHAPLGCTGCHDDIKEVPHQEGLKPVNCGACHEDEANIYALSLHGKALAQGDPLAPSCADCHGKHDILSPQDIQSK